MMRYYITREFSMYVVLRHSHHGWYFGEYLNSYLDAISNITQQKYKISAKTAKHHLKHCDGYIDISIDELESFKKENLEYFI